jgi:peptidoglycan/LPS O-acetylase OafA/YrhL
MSRSSIALSNLRAVVIVIVLAFHSVLAYLASLPAAPYAFDAAPFRWQASPIIDSQRWFGFDLFCAWQDISLMSLMFLLSGIFVPASLARKGSWTFLSDRLLRIGVPLVAVVAILMPVAYYPAYRQSGIDPSVEAYWQHWLALPFWPPGPQWFLWQLLALNVLAAALHRLMPRWHDGLSRWLATAGNDPIRFFVALVAASALAYIPLELMFSPWTWQNYGPFSVQLCRPLHYVVYFLAGYLLGAHGLDRGLLDCDGPLARRWGAWVAAALAGFVLWALPTSQMLDGQQVPTLVKIASGFGFAIACATGGLSFLAICLRFALARTRMLDSLSTHAYSIYLIHYVFVVWLQFAMLSVALVAVGKAAIVFAGTLALSWTLAIMIGNVLAGAQVAQIKRWLRANVGGRLALIKQDD